MSYLSRMLAIIFATTAPVVSTASMQDNNHSQAECAMQEQQKAEHSDNCEQAEVVPQVHSYPVIGTLCPQLTAHVSAQVAGRIKEIFADVGDKVERGQALLTLDPLFLEVEQKKAKTAVTLAQVACEEAELEFKRMKNLWEKEAGGRPSIPQKQFDDAQIRLKQKKLLLEQALIDLENVQKHLDETVVRAPFAGVIVKRFVDPGEAVNVNPVVNLFEIIDLSKLTLEFSLPQELSMVIRPGTPIRAHVEGTEGVIEGCIQTVIPQIDPANRCFKCRAVINNVQEHLKPGAFVSVTVQYTH